jgi:nucleotide-binding universal stress UspA family protein
MRVLLAIDGSASSEAARHVVGSLNWPEGTIIEVVGVVEPLTDVFAAAGIALPTGSDSRTSIAARALERTLEMAAAELEAPGRGVRPVLLEGRAASTIVDRAARLRAEMVVVGSRGLGPLKSMLLGSVSAEVVDHAPCPVLVVRRPSVGSILLAVDGSVASAAAVTFLAGSKFLAGRSVEVLSVGPTDSLATMAPLGSTSSASIDTSSVHRAHREQTEGIAARSTETLLAAGCRARWSISEGNAAHEIIEAARSFGSDLIILGSRGRTGLTRMVLGSVARNVLLHTDASVLIVHEPVRKRLPERPIRKRVPERSLRGVRAERPTVVEVGGA